MEDILLFWLVWYDTMVNPDLILQQQNNNHNHVYIFSLHASIAIFKFLCLSIKQNH